MILKVTYNDQNPHNNTSQTPYFTSDQISYPLFNKPKTNLEMERSDFIAESSKTTQGTIQGWNVR